MSPVADRSVLKEPFVGGKRFSSTDSFNISYRYFPISVVSLASWPSKAGSFHNFIILVL